MVYPGTATPLGTKARELRFMYSAITFRKRQPNTHYIPPRLCNRSWSRSYVGCTIAAPLPLLSQCTHP
jgi:hypothetical protein